MKKIFKKGSFGKGLKSKLISALEENIELKNRIIEVQEKTITLQKDCTDKNMIALEEISKAHDKEIKASNKYSEMKVEKKLISAKLGGVTTQNKRLLSELEKIKNEFEEYKKNKFIVRDLPADKTRGKSAIRVKATRQSNQTKKILKEKLEIRESI